MRGALRGAAAPGARVGAGRVGSVFRTARIAPGGAERALSRGRERAIRQGGPACGSPPALAARAVERRVGR